MRRLRSHEGRQRQEKELQTNPSSATGTVAQVAPVRPSMGRLDPESRVGGRYFNRITDHHENASKIKIKASERRGVSGQTKKRPAGTVVCIVRQKKCSRIVDFLVFALLNVTRATSRGTYH